MSSARLRRKKETLDGEKRYQHVLLAPTFKRYLIQRKKMLQEKIYHLRYIAQDCKDWQGSDMEAIKRGMEISILKYRLAKELAQEAREVLDDMLSDVYPYLSDPRGLEEKVWEVFDDEEISESDETERNEAERKLKIAGFELPRLEVIDTGENPPQEPIDGSGWEVDTDGLLIRETSLVNQQTESLLALLEEKKNQLENLRELETVDDRASTDGETSNHS